MWKTAGDNRRRTFLDPNKPIFCVRDHQIFLAKNLSHILAYSIRIIKRDTLVCILYTVNFQLSTVNCHLPNTPRDVPWMSAHYLPVNVWENIIKKYI